MGTPRVDVSLRFWDKVSFARGAEGCWHWEAGKTPLGYGMVSVDGVCRKAHRVAWKLAYGEDPGAMCVCHSCDNPMCVRPSHLFLGTKADNSRDMEAKGRSYKGGAKCPPRGPRLTPDIVRELRTRHAFGGFNKKQAARDLGVTYSTVLDAVSGRTWGHL